ncbi:MAG: hypothetical protein SGI90_10705, partial [Candidatus Eisenbacteria bacterium]|nr:hypothetical protein [Candidatus Eisenbacteria bacterium]
MAYFLLITSLGLAGTNLLAAWDATSTGLPPVEIVSAKAMGSDTDKSIVLQDTLGRILVGSGSLLVFDGQSWTAHAKPGGYHLTSLVFGGEGVLWATTIGNLGFFREESLGEFKFHSLLGELPSEARNLGPVWGCAPIGPITYFICWDRLLRWDGRSFQISPFPTKRRLAPLKIGTEYWLQHLETGLYRLTETGPELKFTADQLPHPLILGLFRDETGVITVSNDGLQRPGQTKPLSPTEFNQYLTQHKVSSFEELPNGNLLVGTLSGGLVLTDRSGRIIRIWADSGSGLPGRTIIGLATDSSGEVFGTTPTDFFHFPATGEETVFNALNGLKGQVVNSFAFCKSGLYAATDDGTYRLATAAGGRASFEAIPELAARYSHMVAYGDGLLLARFGGVDWFDGEVTRPAYKVDANSALHITPSRVHQGTFFVTEIAGIARLTQQADGSFERTRFLELPDTASSLHEDPTGRLWIGTTVHGAFCYDPATGQLVSINDPASGQPMAGPVQIVGANTRVLFFLNGRVLQANEHGRQLRVLPGLPALIPSVIQPWTKTGDVLLAYQRPASTGGPLHGAGVISFSGDGVASWRELDLPALDAIGSIRTAVFSEENQQPILWLGGMEGVLRLDYDQIPTSRAPSAPIIRMAGMLPDFSSDGIPLYPFKEHHLRFRVFTGDYLTGKGSRFQSRLGDGTEGWSEAAAGRSFDYTNLSEGIYRFEVRAINTAGMTSVPSNFTFRILPPWYRSTWAFAGYTTALLLAVFGFIRVRERRIRLRNQELESLVEVRTAELVKASAAKDEFLAGVSHEIRNPMNGV